MTIFTKQTILSFFAGNFLIFLSVYPILDYLFTVFTFLSPFFGKVGGLGLFAVTSSVFSEFPTLQISIFLIGFVLQVILLFAFKYIKGYKFYSALCGFLAPMLIVLFFILTLYIRSI